MCFVQNTEILTLSFHLIPHEGAAKNLCLKSGHWYKSSLDEIGEFIFYSEKQAVLFGGIRALMWDRRRLQTERERFQ